MTFFIQFAVTPKNKKHAVKRGKFMRVIDDKKVVSNAGQLAGMLQRHVPMQPIPGPVRLDLRFVYPWPKSATKKAQADGAAFKVTAPDRDNVHKQLADCLTKMGFYRDDAEIATGITTKAHWDGPQGVFVSINTLSSDDRKTLNQRLHELRTLFCG